VSDEFDTTALIINTGSIPLRLKSLSFTGPDSSMFIYNGTFVPTTIARGETLRVQFNLFPTAPGPLSATAVFITNGATPVKIYLHANDIVGVEEHPTAPLTSALVVSVAPAPFRDNATVTLRSNFSGPATLSLSDVLGRTVWEQAVMLNGSHVSTMLRPETSPGFHVLSVRSARGIATFSVMIAR